MANGKLKTAAYKKQTKKILESAMPQFFTQSMTIQNPKLAKSDLLVDFDSMIASSNGSTNPVIELNRNY